MKPHNITHNGKTQSLRAWARETGISVSTLYSRLYVEFWPTDRALTEKPSRVQRKGHPWKKHNPEYMSGMRT